jgi:hypothetical protein
MAIPIKLNGLAKWSDRRGGKRKAVTGTRRRREGIAVLEMLQERAAILRKRAAVPDFAQVLP